MTFVTENINSSVISRIEWFKTNHLKINFKNGNCIVYSGVDVDTYINFSTSKSFGKFYNTYIKQKFKTTNMATESNKPKGINKSKKEKRFINMRINLKEVKKEWLYEGEKGKYLDVTLHMLPDGSVDNYGNLGMITQDVPKEVYKKDSSVKGNILGNAQEKEWNNAGAEGAPGSGAGKLADEAEFDDDLPF